jgi:hypothetical protein
MQQIRTSNMHVAAVDASSLIAEANAVVKPIHSKAMPVIPDDR